MEVGCDWLRKGSEATMERGHFSRVENPEQCQVDAAGAPRSKDPIPSSGIV